MAITIESIKSKLVGALVVLLVGISSFTVKWQFDANADIRVLKEQIQRMETEKVKTTADSEIMMHNFWVVMGWDKTQINLIRFNLKLEPVEWPPFKYN